MFHLGKGVGGVAFIRHNLVDTIHPDEETAMSTNSEEIAQQIRCEVEALLTFVVGTASTSLVSPYDMQQQFAPALTRLRQNAASLLLRHFPAVLYGNGMHSGRTAFALS